MSANLVIKGNFTPASILVIKDITDRVNNEAGRRTDNRIRPCEIFGLIGGTVTGG